MKFFSPKWIHLTKKKRRRRGKKTFICIQKSFPSFSKRAESFHAISCVVNFLLAPLFYVFFSCSAPFPFKASLIIYFFLPKAKNIQKQGKDFHIGINKYMSHCVHRERKQIKQQIVSFSCFFSLPKTIHFVIYSINYFNLQWAFFLWTTRRDFYCH